MVSPVNAISKFSISLSTQHPGRGLVLWDSEYSSFYGLIVPYLILKQRKRDLVETPDEVRRLLGYQDSNLDQLNKPERSKCPFSAKMP